MRFASSRFSSMNRFALSIARTARLTVCGMLKANRFIEENRDETIRIMAQSVPQPPDVAARSYDVELKALARDGQMTDAELEFQMERLAEKKRPLDEIRDFFFARQALKELEQNR